MNEKIKREIPEEIYTRLKDDGAKENFTLDDVLWEIEYFLEFYENGWLIENEEVEEDEEKRRYYKTQIKKMRKFYNKYKN